MRIFLSFTVLLLFAVGIYISHVQLRPSDSLMIPESKEQFPATNLKSIKNRKDLWIDQKKERAHIALSSQSSEILFQEHEKKMEARESFSFLRYSNRDQTLTAREGTYDYRSRVMALKGGVQLDNATAQLSAEEATLSLTPSYECRDLFAQGSVEIHTQDGLLAQADWAKFVDQTVILSPSSPSRYVTCSQKEERFILADRCTYSLATKTALLESTDPHRVLFWQKGEAISAPKIEAYVSDHDMHIQAYGDVHCTFTPQEENLIHTFFSKYL